MPDQDSPNPTNTQLTAQEPDPDDQNQPQDLSSDSEPDYYSDSSIDEPQSAAPGANAEVDEALTYLRPGEVVPEDQNTPEVNVKLFNQVLEGKRVKRRQEEEDKGYVFHEDLFDFPEDPEKWREEDLKELWGDAPLEMTKPGWDPVWADEEDWEIVRDEIREGNDPPIAPFYVPYRKPYPVIPEDDHDISNPKAVIEELDRIEEFLAWVSYVFPDGSSYVFAFVPLFSA